MSHQGFDSTFTEFKQQFYSKAGDASAFNVLDINLLKVVLDGLKVQYTRRGKAAHYFDRSILVTSAFFLGKMIRDLKKKPSLRLKLKRIEQASFLVAFSDRTVKEEDKELSVYFQKIFDTFGRSKFCYLTKSNNSIVNADLDLSDLVYDAEAFSGSNLKLYSALKQWLNSDVMKRMWNEEELENIKIATHLFYFDYIKIDSFLKKKPFKSTLLICHYHNEAFIYACKSNGLSVNELQHGLIAEEDIFYVFPSQVSKIVDRALFPDNVLVYGNYWKNVLLKGTEYASAQIKIGGNYQYEARISSNSKVLSAYPGQKIILVTTQYSAEEHFIDYVNRLSPKIDQGWLICIKPHPAEKKDLYSKLEQQFNNVKVVEGNIDEWIERSEFIITIFSTTIFDAIKKGKMAFSLNIPLYSDYINSLTSSGISQLLNLDENSVEKYASLQKKSRTATDFYDRFDKEVFEEVLLGN
ncbi:MAG: sialyltransferase [Bacteroidetes bacterium]|jgi:hypothetical protein|nr:sialyltransferase [Bacteroidota bacterium]